MAYFVTFNQIVRDYCDSLEGLTDDDLIALVAGITDELGRDADYFLARYPLSHESMHFRYDYVHPANRTLYSFEFIVDGSRMEVGVVTVVYGECEIHMPDE